MSENDEEKKGIERKCCAVFQRVAAKEFVMCVPEKREKPEANGERHKAAHGNAQFTEVFRNLQRNDEQGQSQAENHVAKYFEARNYRSAEAEPVFDAQFVAREGHCRFPFLLD